MESAKRPSPRGKPDFPPSSDWDERLEKAGDKLPLEPSRLAYHNDWFSVFDRGGFYTIEEPVNNVIVLPVVHSSSILFVRPFRPVLADAPLELPAGKGAPNESAILTAQRELREETGIWIEDTNRFKPRPPISISPNRMPNLEWVFQVDISESEFQAREKHDEEIHSLELLELESVKQSIKSGEIYISAVVAAVASYIFSLSH